MAVVLIFILYIFRLRITKMIYYGVAIVVVLTLVGYAVLVAENDSILGRTKILYKPDEVFKKISKRYEPFMLEVETWENPMYWIFGKGIGQSFYIPWFEYRKNISNYNPYLDNIYLSLYVKMGLLSLMVYFFLLLYFNYLSNNTTYVTILMLYLLFMGITTAFVYQSYFFIFLLSPILFFRVSKWKSKFIIAILYSRLPKIMSATGMSADRKVAIKDLNYPINV